jgi:hypothetical protein
MTKKFDPPVEIGWRKVVPAGPAFEKKAVKPVAAESDVLETDADAEYLKYAALDLSNMGRMGPRP